MQNSKNKSQAWQVPLIRESQGSAGGQWQFLVSTENKLIQTLPGSEKAEEIKPKGFSNFVVDCLLLIRMRSSVEQNHHNLPFPYLISTPILKREKQRKGFTLTS